MEPFTSELLLVEPIGGTENGVIHGYRTRLARPPVSPRVVEFTDDFLSGPKLWQTLGNVSEHDPTAATSSLINEVQRAVGVATLSNTPPPNQANQSQSYIRDLDA